MSNELLNKLVAEYYASRPNLEVRHSPLCVFFFACSGSGKSTIRRLLVDELQATYVCNDEVRRLLAKHPEAIRQGIELKTIVARTVEKIFELAPNKLVIFDNNIIQYTHDDSYPNVARAKHRPVFIIGLEVSELELERRIKKRGINVAQMLSRLPGQLQDYRKATKDIKPDWIIKSAGGKNDLRELITQLSIRAGARL